jgi:hypothetical protein
VACAVERRERMTTLAGGHVEDAVLLATGLDDKAL